MDSSMTAEKALEFYERLNHDMGLDEIVDDHGDIAEAGLRHVRKTNHVVSVARAVATKFVNKVEHGRARSKETYSELKELLDLIADLENNN